MLSHTVAEHLLHIGAVGFRPDTPLTFKSGIISPVYVDNRRLPFYPDAWRAIINGFAQLIAEKQLQFSTLAGIETAGIPHSAALAFHLQKPSIFVRKQVKDHGTKKRIEGGDVTSQQVLLLEDLVTTGGSSLSGVEALRAEGALVNDCICIVSYGFSEARDAFTKAKVRLHALVSFEDILEAAEKKNAITPSQKDLIQDWLQEPHGWAQRHGKHA